MSVLLSAFEISKSFGAKTLFHDLTFSLESGRKIGLIGPNGAGKSTLMKILARQEPVDGGQLSFATGLRLGFLSQTPTFADGETVLSAVLESTGDAHDPAHIALAMELISRLELDGPAAGMDRPVNELSGGWHKRVALARELAKSPDLLLLDEPTNHLDVPSIEWLENFLSSREDLATLTVTHDRMFLQNTCDYIFDLDRRNPDGLIQFTGTYADFLEFKESVLSAQERLEQTRRNVLRRETAWLRRGAKARQTKQKARIERAGELREEVAELEDRNRHLKVKIDFGEVGRNPKKIIEAVNISKFDGDRALFKDFSFTLSARSRVGLLGPNGCGKTTLVRTLLGDLPPDAGTVKVADGVRFAVFEQKKQNLDPRVSLLKSLCPEGDYVHVQGKPVYAKSYLARFHFHTDQMDLPVGKLSGGEQTRLLLAKLMLQTEPVLVLDEPTNDLDIETLDTLQDALAEFPGAVILVTHDRYFMDQVANEILAFAPEGKIEKFADIFQWETWSREQSKKKPKAEKTATAAAPAEKNKAKIKLSYKEQRDFDGMEAAIQEAEERLAKLTAEMNLPGLQSDFPKLQELSRKIETQQAEVDRLYAHWQELSDKLAGK